MMDPSERLYSHEIYNSLIHNVRRLDSIHVTSLQVGKETPNPSGEVSVNVSFEKGEIVKQGSKLTASPSFAVRVVDEQSQAVFTILVTLEANYTIDHLATFPDNALEMFANTNVVLNLWPYLRELVASLTVRMGYPALLLEPLRLT